MTAVPPRATYRLQIRESVDLARAAEIVPYLARLGVSHLYASPLQMARAGSTHGYDTADPTRIDPALGGDAGFALLVEALRAHGMGLLLDIVPNHMGVGADNPFWMDVLTWGPESPYARVFDIDWEAKAGGTPGRVLLPILGSPLPEVLAAGEISVRFRPDDPAFEVVYFEDRFPLSPRTWPSLCRGLVPPELERALAEATPGTVGEVLAGFRALFGREPDLGAALAAACSLAAEDLVALLEEQFYRLAHWRAAPTMLDYRRFFDINELIGVRVEDPAVFALTHRLLLGLAARGEVDGLRIDHVDGLADPGNYLKRLDEAMRAAGMAEPWILVEKILGPDEELPDAWPVAGTTGYEFLNQLGGLFVDAEGEAGFDEIYETAVGDVRDFRETVRAAKHEILDRTFAGELRRLAQLLQTLAATEPMGADLGYEPCRAALLELVIEFDVYRTYGDGSGFGEADLERLRRFLDLAEALTELEDPTVYAVLRRLLLERGPADPEVHPFVMGLQQLSGPVMAKSLEDTAFYRWFRFAALNEVGAEPDHFGTSPETFHAVCRHRAKRWPLALLPSATHDTKRGEDTRARLAVLSEIAPEWAAAVERWTPHLAPAIEETPSGPAPSAAHVYLFLQTAVGAWPLDLSPEDAAGMAAFAERIAAYLLKAAREGKERTRWTSPDEAYEAALRGFVEQMLQPAPANPLAAELGAFAERIAPAGALNGLSQTLIKLTAPGVPDIYQGAEVWEQSLVDPDNRRPVPFEALDAMLAERRSLADDLAQWRSGAIKQRIVHAALVLRTSDPELFLRGDYVPLGVAGSAAKHVVAFARTGDTGSAVIVAPRLATDLLGAAAAPLVPHEAWGDTSVAAPAARGGSAYRDVMTDRMLGGGELRLSDLLAVNPVALLVSN